MVYYIQEARIRKESYLVLCYDYMFIATTVGGVAIDTLG